MPVNLRRKAIREEVLQQVHQDDTNIKQGPITRGKRRSSGSPLPLAPTRKRAAFNDITNVFIPSQNVTKPKRKSCAPVKAAKAGQTQTTMKDEVMKAVSISEDTSREVSMASSSSGVSSWMSISRDSIQSEDDVEMFSPASIPLPESLSEDELFLDVENMNKKNLKRNVVAISQKDAKESVKSDIKNRVVAIPLDVQTCLETDEPIPEDIINIDEENKDDPNQSPEYAFGIFQYLKQRETLFQVTPYFDSQSDITPHMRAILMDWLVEVQENFELNHESLYLAVKIVDLYLSKEVIAKGTLQLLGATALFISCKFDERCLPALEDFIFICDDAYNRRQFITMERDILKCIDYDLGIPLSYRFLRRYAKCIHASMETLTLSRFILELSLMECEFMTVRESNLASSALLLALMIKNAGKWDATLEYFSGYKTADLTDLVKRLNAMLIKPPTRQLNTVRTKYSHKVFYEVAKMPPLDNISF